MKYFLLSIVISFGFLQSFADGWRPNEMEVKIEITNSQDIVILNDLKIDYEAGNPALNEITAWLVPKELELVEAAGLSYQIEIKNLNDHYKNFWLSDDAYHSYDEIIELADSLETHFPEICKRYTFGMDASGQYELTALKISDNVLTDEPEAEVLFDSGIHGDEIGGPENVIRFARDLCIGYGDDPNITTLIDNREIWLYLMVNPWGRVNTTRRNSNNVDLNRDWAYMWDGEGGSTGYWSQPESKALRECMYNNQFVVHTTYHSGTEYISLPWSYRPDSPADWNHINQLAGVYSNVSGYANLEYGQGNTGMYPINGSTKDSNYGIQGSISWSMEISNSKQPPASQIMMYYNYNYPSMLAMIEYSGYGVQGEITDANTGDPVTAVVFVDDYMPCFSDPTAGDYHKYILPGTYSIKVVANGYQTQIIDNVVVTTNNATTTDFLLQPLDGHYGYKFSASQIAGNNYADEGNTKAVIGAPDDINYSIGKNGWCILDMQYPVIDGAGPDLRIHEGDATAEGYTVYAGETLDGPWISLGTGTGTFEFDLALSGLAEAQFIRINDDGDGSANVANAGFDLDAIEVLEPISGVYLALLNYEVDDSNGNNNGRIDPGETVDIIVAIRNNGDVLAENINGTAITSSPFVEITNPSFNFGDLAQGETTEGTYTLDVSAGAPLGESFILNLEVTANSGTYTNSYNLGFTIGLIIEDWETGDMSQYDWETSGNADWGISTLAPYEGTYSVRSGIISHNQASELSISYNVLNNGEISFFRKVSSESNYDYLMFYIDNTLQDEWSGSVDWAGSTYTVSAGQHTFKWIYNKDGSVSNGSDCGWVDYIILPAGAVQGVVASFNADQTNICEGATVGFNDNSLGNITSWSWEFEEGNPAVSSDQNPEVVYNSSGSFDVSLTVSNGSDSQTMTQENYITVNAIPAIPEMPEGDVEVCTNFTPFIDYTIASITNADSYEWDISPTEAGTITGTSTTGTVEWVFGWEGTAAISVKASNECGDSDYSEGFEVDCIFCTSISERIKLTTEIYPNPSNGVFTIKTDDKLKQVSELRILNPLGKTVYFDKGLDVVNSHIQISLINAKPGIYFIVMDADNYQAREKLIIK